MGLVDGGSVSPPVLPPERLYHVTFQSKQIPVIRAGKDLYSQRSGNRIFAEGLPLVSGSWKSGEAA